MVRVLLGLLFVCTAAAGLVPEDLEERERFTSTPHATLDRYLSVPSAGVDEGGSGMCRNHDRARREGGKWLANEGEPGDVVNAEVDGLLEKVKIAKDSKEYMDDGGKLIEVMEQRVGQLNDDEQTMLEDEGERVDVFVIGDDDPISSSILSQVFRKPSDAVTIPAVPVNKTEPKSVLVKNTTSPLNVTSKLANITSQNVSSPENITSGPVNATSPPNNATSPLNNATSPPVNTPQTTAPAAQNETSPPPSNQTVPSSLPHTISFPLTRNTTPPPDKRESVVESSQFQNITSTQTKTTSQPQVFMPPTPGTPPFQNPSPYPVHPVAPTPPRPVAPPTQHPAGPAPIPMQVRFLSPQPTSPPQRPLPTQPMVTPSPRALPRPMENVQFPTQQHVPPSAQHLTIQTRPILAPTHPISPPPKPTSPPPQITSPPQQPLSPLHPTSPPPPQAPIHPSPPSSVPPKTPTEHPNPPLKNVSNDSHSTQGLLQRDALQGSTRGKDARSHCDAKSDQYKKGQDTTPTHCCQSCMCGSCKGQKGMCH